MTPVDPARCGACEEGERCPPGVCREARRRAGGSTMGAVRGVPGPRARSAPPEAGTLFPGVTGPARSLEGGEREALDAYYTPVAAARACLAALDEAEWLPRVPARPRVLEPSVGGGSWVLAAQDAWGASVDRIDLDPHAPGLGLRCYTHEQAVVGDFLRIPFADVPQPWDVVLGNPPYIGDLTAWFDRSLSLAPIVGYLLRSTVLGSVTRAPWWRAHPPAGVWTLAPRPRWQGPGARGESDTTDSVFVVWWSGITDTRYRLLEWTP